MTNDETTNKRKPKSNPALTIGMTLGAAMGMTLAISNKRNIAW